MVLWPSLLWAQRELAHIDTLPDNMYLDTAHAPFYFGVNSGDPLTKQVIIWTRITPTQDSTIIQVDWEMALDAAFTEPARAGIYKAFPEKDWTVKIDVTNLLPGTTYYYRFRSPDGKYSAVGRTKTLPSGEVDHYRIAGMSCSSVFSGYFNAYRRVGERNDIDLVMHMGDYIYDYVDKDEAVRVPSPYPVDPANLTEFRNRHKYYLTDPDLRLARQQHPWLVVWDNHDVERDDPNIDRQAKQAFFEYLPIREQNTRDTFRIYRSFEVGDLVQINMMDMESYRIKEGNEQMQKTFLGPAQIAWIQHELTSATATWKIMGSQKMVGGWYSQGLPEKLKFAGDGTFFDPSSFDGYYEERDALLQFIGDNKIDNFFVVSGDMHMSFTMNLSPTPKDRKQYKRRTGKGSVGVEFMPTSISRGNLDESGMPAGMQGVVVRISKSVNPHHHYMDMVQHGYGIMDITPERIVAEFWYSPVLKMSDTEKFGGGYIVREGTNKWQWGHTNRPTK